MSKLFKLATCIFAMQHYVNDYYHKGFAINIQKLFKLLQK